MLFLFQNLERKIVEDRENKEKKKLTDRARKRKGLRERERDRSRARGRRSKKEASKTLSPTKVKPCPWSSLFYAFVSQKPNQNLPYILL